MNKRILLFIMCQLASSSLLIGSGSEPLRTPFATAYSTDDTVKDTINNLLSRGKDPLKMARRQKEIQRIIHELKNDPDNKSSDILQEMKLDGHVDAEEEARKEIDAIKWQNTLLTDPRNFVGFYKSDFIKIGLMAAETYADVKLYRELTRRRIEIVIASMLSDVDTFIALIKRVNDSEQRYEERMGSMSTFAQMFTDQVRGRDILLNPLRRYLVENHSLVKGYIPFNRDTLVPLATRWIMEKFSEWLEDKLLVKSLWTDKNRMNLSGVLNFMKNPRREENIFARCNAYQRNEAGQLEYIIPQNNPNDSLYSRAKYLVTEDVPWSASKAVSALMMVINPARGFQKLTALGTSSPWLGKFANKYIGLGLPEFFFSDSMRLGFEVLGMGFAAKFYDAINNAKWGAYVLQNRDDLLKILTDYRRALDNASSGEDAIAQAEQKIREYVEKGHESSSWLPFSALSEWWTTRDAGISHVNKWLRYGTAALLTWKLGRWWLSRGSTES